MSSLPHLALARATVDRDCYAREDVAVLDELWAAPQTRVLVVSDGETLVDDAGTRLVTVAPDDAPPGERYYLGRGDGGAFFAVRSALPEALDGARPAGLREIGTTLDDQEAGVVVHAVALERWHATHQHCPRCGTPTEVVHGGSQRDCPADGSSHFPRVDPAVIMLVYADDGRCVLGRQAVWPAKRFSVLAGFVEPGEALEHAVAREVEEEVSLRVDDVRYVASQPWPFPSSLMLGFTARVVGGELAVDERELADARWFSKAELTAALADGSLLLPPPVSIARRLVETWYGEPLSD